MVQLKTFITFNPVVELYNINNSNNNNNNNNNGLLNQNNMTVRELNILLFTIKVA